MTDMLKTVYTSKTPFCRGGGGYNNPVILSEVFQRKIYISLLHLITVYLHVHELQLIDVLMWLFDNV